MLLILIQHAVCELLLFLKMVLKLLELLDMYFLLAMTCDMVCSSESLPSNDNFIYLSDSRLIRCCYFNYYVFNLMKYVDIIYFVCSML